LQILQEKNILSVLLQFAMRLPRLAIAVLVLALIVVIGILAYATFLVIGTVAEYLGTSRFVAGLMLGVLFARIPWVRQGKLRTVGLLPKAARQPAVISLLALCSLHFLLQDDFGRMTFLGFAAIIPLAFQRMKKRLISRVLSPFLRPSPNTARPQREDENIIDAEFREKKD
jgi:hypothetical protein